VAPRRPPAWLPWLLCAVSLAMMIIAGWLRWLLRDRGLAEDADLLEGVVGALGFAGVPVVGALIAARLPANPEGWLWCGTGLAYAVSDICGPLVRTLGGPPWVIWVGETWGFVVLLGLLVFVFLLFPTGRLPTYRWRWLGRAAVLFALVLLFAVTLIPDPEDAAAASPWAVHGDAARVAGQIAEGLLFAMFGLLLLGMTSLVLRFRRADPVERRQLAWFLYATVLNGSLIVIDTLGIGPSGGLTETTVSAAGFALLPVAVGVAMLRYRLFEIDRIVSRTVSYGLLTAAIFAVYLLVVATLSQLGLPQGSSDAVVAAVTLGVAATVGRLRRRLQAAVDRRFDRARYDAGRAVDAFAARLRDQVDLDEISAGLRDTVTATVAPAHMVVWLRPESG
jgi:hypothetical protein